MCDLSLGRGPSSLLTQDDRLRCTLKLRVVSGPDEFVHLELETDVQFVGEDPFDDFTGIDPAENRREQDRATACGQIEALRFFARPFVIFARSDDELHFVPLFEIIDVRPKVLFDFSAPGRFQIHDAMNARIDCRNVVGAAGFKQHRVAGIAQHRHQRQHIFLQ